MTEERIDSDSANPSPTPLSYASPGSWESKWGKGFLAACGGFVLWGLGQWIAGFRRRGIAWFIVWVLLTAAELLALALPKWTGALFVLLPLQVVLFLVMTIDAFVRGRGAARPMLGRPIWRYVAGVIIILIGQAAGRGINRVYDSLAHRLGANTVAITTHAMQPTLQPGDRIISHRDSNLSRWDLVVFRPPGRNDLFTQRVVGLPGEKVELMSNQLFINDRQVSPPAGVRPYISRLASGRQTGCEGHPIRLGPGEYYLLGDNSAVSYDCRLFPDAEPGHQIGAIPRESILGRVTAIYWPIRRLREFR
jgi:signal peptidase I